MVGRNQCLWFNAKRIGGGNQVWFVAHQKIHDGDQNIAVTQAFSKRIRRKAGEREQAFGVIIIA